jgi:flavorubredoxin
MKFKMIDSGLKYQYVPDSQGLISCREMGKKIGRAVLEHE